MKDDVISRRSAIDVLHGYFDGMLETDTVCPADIYGLFKCIPSAQPEQIARDIATIIENEQDMRVILNAPSAQSEIIRCKDCMHNGSYDTDCPIDWNGKEYCSFAERKEDE